MEVAGELDNTALRRVLGGLGMKLTLSVHRALTAWKRHGKEYGSRQLRGGGTGVGWGIVGDERRFLRKLFLLYLGKSFREMWVKSILWALCSFRWEKSQYVSMLTQESSREVNT